MDEKLANVRGLRGLKSIVGLSKRYEPFLFRAVFA